MTNKTLQNQPQKRLDSLDALRGFDMFWITGGAVILHLLATIPGLGFLEAQTHHVAWEGLHFEDLIFPLFMFMAGVAIPFAIKSKLENGWSKNSLIFKASKRLILLIVLGILYNGVFRSGFENPRIASVLGQIGIGYFFSVLIVVYFKSFKSRLIWLASILVGFAIIHLLIPVPGFGSGVLTPDGSINGFIDRLFLPGRLYGKVYDPEGILCSLSATGVTLMGTIAGNILRRKDTTDWKKISYLTIAGVAAIALALILSPVYPIIKKCWTSTFNLLAGGISFLLMALFFYIIDHLGYRKWAFYFRVIGMNSIFVYLFTRIVDVNEITQFFFGWIIQSCGDSADTISSLFSLAIIWLLLYYMFTKKIFLRV